MNVEYKKIKINIFLTKPKASGTKVMLTKKNLHHFFNRKPVDIVLPIKTIFYELYQQFTVRTDTCLPFVFLHFYTEDLESYDIRVLHDTRYVSFPSQDEAQIVRKLHTELQAKFKELYAESQVQEEKLVKEEIEPTENLRFTNQPPTAARTTDPGQKEAIFKDKVQLIKERI